MVKCIPFNEWFPKVEEIMEAISKCNFDVLEMAGSYTYGNLKINSPREGLFVFTKSDDAEQFNPAPIGNSLSTMVYPVGGGTGTIQQFTSQPQQQYQTLPALTGGLSVTSGYTSAVIPSKRLISYSVAVTCTRDLMVKLEVTEFWSESYSVNETKIHSIVFHDNDILANGEWFKIDSPEAFTHDLNSEEISMLAMIEIFEKFKKRLDEPEAE